MRPAPPSRAVATSVVAAAAAGSAVFVMCVKMARAARREAKLAEEALFEAQEAASVAAGPRRARRRRGDSKESAGAARAPHPPAPNLGYLGLGKLVGAAEVGVKMILAGYVVDELLHRGPLSVPRGALRAHVRSFLKSAAQSVKVTGLTTLSVAAVASFKVTYRALRALRGSGSGAGVEHLCASAVEELGMELHDWGNKMEICDLQTHSEGEVGWLLRERHASRIVDQTADFHRKLKELGRKRGSAPISRALLLEVFGSPKVHVSGGEKNIRGWDAVVVFLVPGLWTKWYPLYWVHLRRAFRNCAIDYVFSQSNTDSPLDENTAVIMKELREILETFPDRKVLVYSHSKGCLDVADAVHDLEPHEKERICGFVSTQGPFGGAILGNDVLHTRVVKGALILLFEILLGGAGRAAVKDMSYEDRRAYYARKPEPWWVHPALREMAAAEAPAADAAPAKGADAAWVPTVCLCCAATHQPKALLAPIVEYYRYRYGKDGAVDGLCSRTDCALPGACCVFLSDMDHFGPAWTGFPAMDRYDSVDLFFVLSAMAFHRNTTANRQAKKLRALRPKEGATRRLDDDDDAFLADCSEGFQTSHEDDAAPRSPGLTRVMSRVTSWGFFA